VFLIVQAKKNFIEIIAHFSRFAMRTSPVFSQYLPITCHTDLAGVDNALQIAQKVGTCPNDKHCHRIL
jgi:hypothetical protein